MKLKDLILNMVSDKASELGNNAEKIIDWLAEFAAQPDEVRLQQLEDYRTSKKTELLAIKAGLAAQKLQAEKDITTQIGKIDNIAVELAKVAPVAEK